MLTADYDILVIGGGINGAAIAREAAGRNYSVFLAEANDYASATSGASSKLIHGGLRYLERMEFQLVRESLREREILLKTAPRLVRPLDFLVPLHKGARRPAWLIHLGLRLYDLLSIGKSLARTKRIRLADLAREGSIRTAGISRIFSYADCQVDDARLTLEVLLDARDRGAEICNYTRVTKIVTGENVFEVTTDSERGERTVTCRHLINAAGPWVNEIMDLFEPRYQRGSPEKKPLKLVRGSHIVLPLPEGADQNAWTLFRDDGRVVFVIPWFEGRCRIVGTTEVAQTDMSEPPVISDAERDYLIDACNEFFEDSVSADDVVWSWSGVRALVGDGSDEMTGTSRGYALEIFAPRRSTARMVSVYGGKLTTHRRLGERAVDLIEDSARRLPWLPRRHAHWSQDLVFAGEADPSLPLEGVSPETARRLRANYGHRAERIASRLCDSPMLSTRLAPTVVEAELQYAVEEEDVRTADDFLYRRTKLGLELEEKDVERIERWITSCAVRHREKSGE